LPDNSIPIPIITTVRLNARGRRIGDPHHARGARGLIVNAAVDMARGRLAIRAVDAEREHPGGESIAAQNAVARAGEALLPAIGIPLAGDAESAGVAGGDKLVETRPDADLHALARFGAECE
jgi:hypothetical protein